MGLERILNLYEKKLGGIYDINLQGRENLQSGKALYAAAHHHHFDTLMVAYTICREANTHVHYLAKSSLFKLPILGRLLEEAEGIPIIRPYKQKKHEDGMIERIPNQKLAKKFMENYKTLKQQVMEIYRRDEPIAFALAGTRTHGEREDEFKYLENGEIKESPKTLISLLTPIKDLDMIPVNVDVHEDDSDSHFIDGMKALLGLRKKQKIPVDISIGEPIHIGTYLKTHTKQELAKEVRDRYWKLKK